MNNQIQVKHLDLHELLFREIPRPYSGAQRSKTKNNFPTSPGPRAAQERNLTSRAACQSWPAIKAN